MKGSLDEIFKPVRPPVDIPPQGEKEDSVGPEMLGDCVSLQRRSSLFGIGLKLPGKPDKVLEYFDLEADGDNSHLKIIMGARKVWLIEIEGRNLLRLLYLMKERKIEWIRQADRDFGQDDGKPFISRLRYNDVTEDVRKD